MAAHIKLVWKLIFMDMFCKPAVAHGFLAHSVSNKEMAEKVYRKLFP